MSVPNQSPNSDVTTVDGSIDFSGGVDSIKVPTIQSQANPNGLARNELSWLINGTVRDGGITPRGGWKFVSTVAQGPKVVPNAQLYQGGYMYNPIGANPYLVLSISGNIIKVDPLNLVPLRNIAIEDSVSTIPTPPPWTITLMNVSTTTDPAIAPIIPPVGSIMSQVVPTSGSGVTNNSVFYLGIGYNSFTVPPVAPSGTPLSGAGPYSVVVNLATPYTGNVGDVLPLVNNVVLKEIPKFISIGSPTFASATAQGLFKVVAFTAPFQTLTTKQPGNPAFLFKSFFCQAEDFLIINAGDNATLPLIWDGQRLRRSRGITNFAVAPGTPAVNELPPGSVMDYYMGRLWYAQGSTFSAGDIVGGASGTIAYNFRDSVLNVTENPLVLGGGGSRNGGDGFAVPRNEGDITALAHNANQDSGLGQGKLFAFTAKGAHQLSVPVTRTAWIAANSNTQPLLVPVQLANGTASDRSVVAVNGDLFYQSPQADIRTLITATRYFNQWGNIPISANVNRVTQFADKELLNFATGIFFDNRVLQSTLPILSPQGCVHQALIVQDFTSISQYGEQLQPTWEGMYEGLDILQLFTGVFDGQERAFAIVVSRVDQSLQLWEITADERFDNTDTRIKMMTEFPALTWGNEFSLKQQVSAELWIDRLFGEVVFLLEYRPDGESCWNKWHEWKVCSPRNSCENNSTDPCTGLSQAICYPLVQFGENYRQTMTLPTPPNNCAVSSGRPAYVNYQCQVRLTTIGFCRVRGLLLHAEFKERKLYNQKVC